MGTREIADSNQYRPILNPLYIEQYGYTYLLPTTFVNALVPTFDTRDTTKLLFIDTYNMTLVGKTGMYYGSLEPVSMDDYRPYYWANPHGLFDDPATFDDKVREYIEAHKADFGESIRNDYGIMRRAFIYAEDRPPLLLDDPPEYPRDTSDHFGDFMAGFLSAGFMNGGWGHKK